IANPELRGLSGMPNNNGFNSIAPLLQRDAGGVASQQNEDSPGWLGPRAPRTSGIGIHIDGVDPRSPACGRLKSGDIIERIDGTQIATLDGPSWAAKLMAGAQGTPVWLRVKRESAPAELVTLIRVARPNDDT